MFDVDFKVNNPIFIGVWWHTSISKSYVYFLSHSIEHSIKLCLKRSIMFQWVRCQDKMATNTQSWGRTHACTANVDCRWPTWEHLKDGIILNCHMSGDEVTYSLHTVVWYLTRRKIKGYKLTKLNSFCPDENLWWFLIQSYFSSSRWWRLNPEMIEPGKKNISNLNFTILSQIFRAYFRHDFDLIFLPWSVDFVFVFG